MSQDSVVLNKSLRFAARIVKLYQYLCKEKHETIISEKTPFMQVSDIISLPRKGSIFHPFY